MPGAEQYIDCKANRYWEKFLRIVYWFNHIACSSPATWQRSLRPTILANMRLALVEAFHAYIRDEGSSSSSSSGGSEEVEQGGWKVRQSDACPTNGQLTVPGCVRRRLLPPPLACLSTPADTTPAAAVGDVSSSAAGQLSRPAGGGGWITVVIAELSVWRAEQPWCSMLALEHVAQRRCGCGRGRRRSNSSSNCCEPKRQETAPLSFVSWFLQLRSFRVLVNHGDYRCLSASERAYRERWLMAAPCCCCCSVHDDSDNEWQLQQLLQ